MKVLGLGIAVLFALAAPLQAGPLDLRQVPAGVQWVAHVDVDVMRGPDVFENAFAAVTEHWNQVEAGLQPLCAMNSGWIWPKGFMRLRSMEISSASPRAYSLPMSRLTVESWKGK